jgi:pimeloyl-ACP methyl ester carboxylesterase
MENDRQTATTSVVDDRSAESEPRRGPRAVTYPYRRIELPEPTPDRRPDPYGNDDPEWLLIDWRQHLGSVELNGGLVNYAAIGEGPPVVFIHGLGGCWQNWLDNLPYFAAAGYRAIAIDLPGFGSSPMPSWEISVPAYGLLIDEFCVRLGLDGATLVGNSMGGFIAAETAIAMPSWIDRLVLVSAAGISHARMRREPVMAISRALHLLNPLTLRVNRGGLGRPGVRQLAFQGVFRHPQRIRRELLHEYTATAVGAPGMLPAIAALTGYDFLDRLPRIGVPTLLVWGRNDLVVPAADAPGYQQRIPDCTLEIFDDCGHVPMSERPVRFNRLVGEFIAQGAPA